MKVLYIVGVAVLLGSAVAAAQSEEQAATAEKKRQVAVEAKALTTTATRVDSPLVAASKKKPAGAKKAKLEINDKTVKSSKGKISETPGLPLVKPPTEIPDHREKLEKYDKAVVDWQKEKTENAAAIVSLAQEIADLEALTGSFEEQFYNEDDPGYREMMEDKFNRAQERLAKAREELAAARANEQALANGKPRLD